MRRLVGHCSALISHSHADQGLNSFLSGSDKLVLGGGLVFTFLKAKGQAVGSSMVEEDFLDLARSLMAQADEKNVSILLPIDILCADKFDNEVRPTGKAALLPLTVLGLS